MSYYRRGSRIFERGGVQARIQDFSQAPPPLDIVRVTSSDLRKFEKHPHSWTFTSTPPLDIVYVTSSAIRKIEKHPYSWTFTSTPPPFLDIVCVTSSAIRKIEKHPHSWTFTKGGGPTLGPNVKKPTLWPKRGGSGPPGPPPPGSATVLLNMVTSHIIPFPFTPVIYAPRQLRQSYPPLARAYARAGTGDLTERGVYVALTSWPRRGWLTSVGFLST